MFSQKDDSVEDSQRSQTDRNADINPFDDPEEKRVIFAALDSFRQYRRRTHYNTTHRRRQNLYALPQKQWQFLAAPPFNLLSTLTAIDDAIDANADIADAILDVGLRSFGLEANPSSDSPLRWHDTATANDHGKAHSTIRQFYRDWSAEGSQETALITETVLSDLSKHLPSPHNPSHNQTPKSILLPGAGLARLLLSLILHGYNATGNEISYHQLLASNWVLNHIPPPTPSPTSPSTIVPTQYPLHPFCTTFTNLPSRTSQLRRVLIPDIHPATAITSTLATGAPVGEMNMVAGDFLSVYSSPDHHEVFDAVVTVFFIDTAPNVIRYIETVRNCLRPGGVWINVGPLLWHFDERRSGHQRRQHSHDGQEDEDMTDGDGTNPSANANAGHNSIPHSGSASDPNSIPGIEQPGSIELSADEIIHLLPYFGFKVLPSDSNHVLTKPDNNSGSTSSAELGYISDPDSMLKSVYRCAHWVARKDGP